MKKDENGLFHGKNSSSFNHRILFEWKFDDISRFGRCDVWRIENKNTYFNVSHLFNRNEKKIHRRRKKCNLIESFHENWGFYSELVTIVDELCVWNKQNKAWCKTKSKFSSKKKGLKKIQCGKFRLFKR